MSNKELIETARQAMEDLLDINQGRLLEHEQTAYNCLRLLCDRLQSDCFTIKTMDLSKQEILKKYETYVTMGHPYNTTAIFLQENVLEAMEEYAEQEAKAYASWLSNTVIRGRTASKLWDDYKAEIGPIIPA